MAILTLGFIALLAYVIYAISRIGHRDKRIPPGPPTVPILGNLLIFPRTYLHLQFSEWAKQYGDIYSLKVMNKTMIVLNSPSAIKEIIDKNGAASSNRPHSILADMICPDNNNLGTGRFANDTWKVLRKATAQCLSNDALTKHRDLLQAESAQLIYDMATTPKDWYRHQNRHIMSFTFAVTYGLRTPRVNSPILTTFLHVHERFINALELGRMPPVDLFPIMTLVPARFAKWKRTITSIREEHESLYTELLEIVEKRLDTGLTTPGFMEEAVKNKEEWGISTRAMMFNLGGTILEGADTASAALQSAVLHFIKFPHTQLAARAELDRVIGADRMPTIEDLPNLPYTMAFVEEVNRFRPVGPLGVPHAMVEDTVIDGFLYPKDAVLFLNAYGMFHDERYYDRPEEFLPERWLKNQYGVRSLEDDDQARRPNLFFGGGRRVCPGMWFAKSSMVCLSSSL